VGLMNVIQTKHTNSYSSRMFILLLFESSVMR
jgi:hypothetical protein